MSIALRKLIKHRRFLLLALLFGATAVVMSIAPAYAADTADWCGGMDNFMGFLSGPIVKYISLAAIFIGGAALVFGEDLGSFTKRLLAVAVAASVLAFASSFFTTFFSPTGNATCTTGTSTTAGS